MRINTISKAVVGGKPEAAVRSLGRRQRRWAGPALGLAALALVFAPFGLAPYALDILALGLVYGLFTYGLDLSWGRVGLISIAHAAFFGVGAYAVAIGADAGLPMLGAAAIGVVLATLMAAAVGAVAVSVPEETSVPLLILLTLGVSQLLQRTATSLPGLTGGANGKVTPALDLVGGYYIVLATCVVVVALTYFWLLRSRRALFQMAALSNPLRAEHLGIHLRSTRLVAFTVSGAVSAAAGALFAPISGIVTPTSLGLALSTSVLTWLAVGGKGSVAGPFIGAGVLTIGTHTLSGAWQSWYIFATAALFIVVVQVAPSGFAGAVRRALNGGRDLPALPPRLRPLKRYNRASRDLDAPLLHVQEVQVSYGGTPVLQGVSLTVQLGECVCLIGPNGAGKSTLLAAIAGSVEVLAGKVALKGDDITHHPTYRRVRMGMGRMFQIPRVFDELTVADNRRAAAVMAGQEHRAQASEFQVQAAELSMSDQRHLELDMVMTGPPELLLLDEPAAGLSHDETTRLAKRIRVIAADGNCGVLVVEHDMELVRELADRVVVLSRGRVIAEGTMDEITAHDAVRAAYLGVT